MKKIFIILIIFASLSWSVYTYAEVDLNLNIIAAIESSHNHLAYNEVSGARGLYQITKICLIDYNVRHYKKYTQDDLFDIVINEKIATWYLKTRIPNILKYYGCEVTLRNVLISYNAGIAYVVNEWELLVKTQNYINKYKEYER